MKPEDLIKTRARQPAVHLNLRITGDDAVVWEEYVKHTPGLQHSQRCRDAIRIALYVLLADRNIIKKLGVLRADRGGQ